jgi:SPP1 family predicted phage head-tail adaptor
MKQPYCIGELQETITLRRYTEAIDAYGTIARTATTIASGVFAHVRPLSGRERDRGQQTEARANYLVVIRYRTDLTEKDFVVWQGVEYGIRFIMDRGSRSTFLELECERGAPQ